MNSFPRRSPRLNQQSQNAYPQQPLTSIPSFQSYSQPLSLSSSSHPSPTNDHIELPEQSPQYSLQLQPQFLAAPNQGSNVPLPSPSANDFNPFFSRNQYYSQEMSGQPQQNSNTSSTAQTNDKSYQNQQSQHEQHHNSFSQAQRSNYPPTSVNGVPPGLPPDFLAEAAKRAQMACLMRDMDDVSL